MVTPTSLERLARRIVAAVVILCLLGTGFARTGARPARAQANARVQAAAPGPEPAPRPAGDHFLRDSIPAAGFAAAGPDTTDDDFVLPEEKSRGQIAKEIAVWVVAAAFVAFFIVKVFIENDDEPSGDKDNGKDIPLPQ